MFFDEVLFGVLFILKITILYRAMVYSANRLIALSNQLKSLRFGVKFFRHASKLTTMGEILPTEAESATISENLNSVLTRIKNASTEAEKGPYYRGRQPTLVAVSKTKHSRLVKFVFVV
uniref:Transposase n=1 Tax=Syphacia muris TaxID=451379 RepID=A0A0N5AXS9_9BILA